MKKFVFAVLCCFCISVLPIFPALAGETGHYVNGVEGIKCGSLPGPGTYYKMYNAFYKADKVMRNDSSKNSMLDFDAFIFANVHRFLWVTESKKTDGDFAVGVIVPMIYTDLTIDVIPSPVYMEDDQFNMGDPYAEVIWSWHKTQYDFAAGAGVYIPIGKYDVDEIASPGKDMWTGMFNLAYTLFADKEKTWAASFLARYEIHSEKDKAKVKPGHNVNLEWGLSKNLAKIIDVGVVGYCQWQMTDDGGSRAENDDHDKVYAIGPEISVFIPPAKALVSLRSEVEFGAEDRSEGYITTLTIVKIF